MARSTFKVLFYVNGSKEKDGIVPIMGPDKRICYSGYKKERPVFDLSAVKPENERVIVFYVCLLYTSGRFHFYR